MKVILKRILLLSPLLILLAFTSTKAAVVHIEDSIYYQDAVFAKIKAAENYAAGLTTDGRLFVVGENDYGRLGTGDSVIRYYPTNITDNFNLSSGEYITMFDTGQYHMVAVTNLNSIYVWGWNNNRQLGDGTTTSRNLPMEITSRFGLGTGENIIDVEASLYNTFVLTSAGRYFSWGSNFGGIIGNNSTALVDTVSDNTAFLSLESGEILVDIQSNDSTVLAMSNIGNLYGWGSNIYGQLFLGDTTDRLTNTLLNGAFGLDSGETITAYSAGDDFSVVATSDGQVYSAGKNTIGQLGDGTGIDRTTPTLISGPMALGTGEYVTHIDNYGHTIIATNQNRVFGWGWNSSGCIGDGIGTYVYLPFEVTSFLNLGLNEDIIGIAASYSNSHIVTNENNYYAWGGNGYGKFMFGYGDIMSSPEPLMGPKNFDILEIQDYLGSDVELVSSNYKHTVVKTESGEIYTWGYNYYGALGTGDKEDRITPFKVTESLNLGVAEEVSMIATGDRHTVYLTSDHRVLTTGNNQYGMLGTGNTVEQLSPFDMTVRIPLNPTEYIVKVYAGGYQTFLLSNEGNVFAMGRSIEGQLTLLTQYNTFPTNITSNLGLDPLEEVVDIYVGYRHTLVHTSNDRLLAFGDNSFGQLGDGTNIPTHVPVEVNLDNCYDTGLADLLEIGVGYNHNVVLTNNNDVCSWGINESGELGEGGAVNRNLPYQINNQFVKGAEDDFIHLSVGKSHNFIMTVYGNSYSWGDGYSGMLATGDSFDNNFPEDVTSNITIGSGIVSEYVLGAFYTYVLTNEGSLYGVGSNSSGFLGLGTLTTTNTFKNVSKDIDDLRGIRFLYLPGPFVDSSEIRLKIYPEYNILSDLVSVRIDGVDRNLTYLSGEDGEIVFSIANTYTLGQTVSMEVDGFTFVDGYVAASGVTTVTSVVVEDDEGPTFDTIPDQTIEVGMSDIDWTLYMENVFDNSGGIVTLYSTETVNYNVLGTYSATVYAEDESGNSTSQTFAVTVVDTTDPVVTYIGPSSFEAGSVYDLSTLVTAIDNYDGDISGQVVITDGIDIGSPGYGYQITFDVSDSSGNNVRVTYSVSVVDTTPPTFDDLEDVGPFDVGVIVDEDWANHIVNLSDNSTDTITTGFSDNIDYTYPGIYSVSVWAEDESGNRTTKQFSVELVDGTPPDINQFQNIEIGLGDSFAVELYFTAYDLVDGDVSFTLMIDDSEVDYNTVGVYSITVYAWDESMNEQQVLVDVHIHDLFGPTFDLVEQKTFELGEVSEYDWLTLVSNLADDSMIMPNIFVHASDVDFMAVGQYTVVLRAVDGSDNFTDKQILVSIEDTTPPVLEEISDLIINQDITELTIDDIVPIATDLSMQIDFSLDAPIVFGTVGNYICTMIATDASGNATSVTFIVSVIDDTPPEVELIGEEVITIELGGLYEELGATCLDMNCTLTLDASAIPDEDDQECGEYIVYYTGSDEAGNETIITRTVMIQDTTAPIIHLLPGIDTILQDVTHLDGGIMVYELDEYIIDVDSDLDSAIPGTYTITYTVTDQSLNETEIIRYVTVLEKDPEVEFNIGASLTTILKDGTFNTPSCTVLFDGTPTPCVFDTSNVDAGTVGRYEFTASAEHGGVSYEVVRYVWIFDVGDEVNPDGYYRKEDWEVLL
jgi:alpha-tubulin suppressor-like RCC1 family protein